MANLNNAIAHYNTDALMILSQPSRDNEPLLEWNKKRKGTTKNWWWDTGYKLASQIDVHMVLQHWGSTACGWGGMGGAAMTNSYTTIIHAKHLHIVAVYYSGKLAYIIEEDPSFTSNWGKIPAYSSLKKENSLYLNPRR